MFLIGREDIAMKLLIAYDGSPFADDAMADLALAGLVLVQAAEYWAATSLCGGGRRCGLSAKGATGQHGCGSDRSGQMLS